MLVIQMAATHALAMRSARLLGNSTEINQQDSNALTLSRLQRNFTLQAEALAKLQRGGKQKVVVEHVHVYQGGQAIVGTVTQPGIPGASLKMETNPMQSATTLPSPSQVTPRCLARTRSGKPCQTRPVSGKRRCRMHGGAKGSGAPKGLRNGSYRHGRYTAEARAAQRELRAWLRELRRWATSIC